MFSNSQILTLFFVVHLFRDEELLLLLPSCPIGLALVVADNDVVDALFLAENSLVLLICRLCCFCEVIISGLLQSVSDCNEMSAAFLAADAEADDVDMDFFRRCGTRPGNSSRRSRASK